MKTNYLGLKIECFVISFPTACKNETISKNEAAYCQEKLAAMNESAMKQQKLVFLKSVNERMESRDNRRKVEDAEEA